MRLEITNPEACGRMGVVTLNRAFEMATREYGIDQINGTVKLSFKPYHIHGLMLSVSKTGIAVEAMGAAGQTYSYLLPGNVSLVRLMPAPDMGFEDIVKVWCHELKHVAQHLLGELVIKKDEPNATWMGKIYTNEQIRKTEHDDLPWEKDAIEASERALPKVMEDIRQYAASPEGLEQLHLATEELLNELLTEAKVQGNA